MYELIQRTSPDYNVVPDYFIKRFETQVMSSYVRSLKNNDDLPFIDDNLLLNNALHPELWAASYLDYKQHPRYYLETTEGMSITQIHDLNSEIYEMLNQKPDPNFDDLLYWDVQSFLEHHHIAYRDLYFYNRAHRNLPIRQVW